MLKKNILLMAAVIGIGMGSFHLQALNVNVKDYGAKGSGGVNDRAAIQAAIDAVANAGGGYVYFPAGTYIVDIVQPASGAFEWSKSLTIKSNVKLYGQGTSGTDYTAIKLEDGAGNYGTILGGAPLNADLSGFAMENIVIDNNSSNNTLTSYADFNSSSSWAGITPRCSVAVQAGSNIKIQNCKFINCKAIWTVFLCGSSNLSVINNSFENIGGGSIDFDASTLYAEGDNGNFIGNTFTSASGNNPGSLGLRTAIEIHRKNHLIKDNKIYGFIAGINIGGSSPDGTENVIAQNNTIENTYSGIVLWPNEPGNQKDYGLTKISIFGNNITLNFDGWVNVSGSYGTGVSIAQNGSSDRKVKWLDICNNTITFQNTARRNRPTDVDKYSSGVHYNRTFNSSSYNQTETIHINNNTILNAVSEGIYVCAPVLDFEACSNTIKDSGQCNTTWIGFCAGMLLVNTFEDAVVAGNAFTDDQSVKTMGYGIQAENDVNGYNVEMSNTISGSSYGLFARDGGAGSWTHNPTEPAISRFYFYDANNGAAVFDPLISGRPINQAELVNDLAFRAVVSNAGSVVFSWEKPDGTVTTWNKSSEWYYIYNGKNTFSQGVHKITATPYSGANATGQQGTPRSVVFHIYNYTSALTDSDNDGMPDAYEVFYGFDKNNAADAAADADGDGYSNLKEYLNGTNPFVPEGILYLKLDEASGTSCADSSNNGNAGQIMGGGSRTAGISGKGVTLNGVSTDYINVANNATLGGMSQLTLSAWVNFKVLKRYDMIMGKNYAYLLAKTSDGVLYFNYSKTGSSWDGAAYMAAPTLTAGDWHHIAVTYNKTSGNVIFYVDGAQVGSRTLQSAGSIFSTSSNLEIGRLWSGWELNGVIDEVRVHNQELSSNQINNMYKASHIPIPVPLF